jgi:hypothetical protein
VGADPAEARAVKTTLARHGVRDVGSATALYLSDDWRPRIARDRRLRARAARRDSIELEDVQVGLLQNALRELTVREQALGGGGGERAASSVGDPGMQPGLQRRGSGAAAG